MLNQYSSLYKYTRFSKRCLKNSECIVILCCRFSNGRYTPRELDSSMRLDYFYLTVLFSNRIGAFLHRFELEGDQE